MSLDGIPDEVPAELVHALDRLVEALDQALESGDQQKESVARAVRECAGVARKLGLAPEILVIALKPRLEAEAARRNNDEGERYLRALVTLAIETYFGDDV